MRIAVIGNYLPRICGIATYTANFVNSLTAAGVSSGIDNEVFVLAINDPEREYNYPEEVRYSIRQQHPEDYAAAAALINDSRADICVLEHEFGIFGGISGVFILSLLDHLRIPLITTFHTVPENPSFHEKHILAKIGERSALITVMSSPAIDMLNRIYGITGEKIRLVHHGVPDFSATPHEPTLRKAYPGKIILCTFGLLGRGKGIETVLNALPDLLRNYPSFVYIVLGKTHPIVRQHSGESYREQLKALAVRNGLEQHVVFMDEFPDEDRLRQYLLDVDIYITPYPNRAQISSGTLSYALGAGTCIVSTPYWHAAELLADSRGILFDFGDSQALAGTLSRLCQDPNALDLARQRAFAFGRQMYWPKIGWQYVKLMRQVLVPVMTAPHPSTPAANSHLPAFNFSHIQRLTDHTGILEHSCFSVASLKEGYCLDDNARALILVLKAWRQGLGKGLLDLTDTYLRYIKLMQKEDGSFHNRCSYDRRINAEGNSEDAFGRTIWGLGYLIEWAPHDAYLQFANEAFFRASAHLTNLRSVRGIAYSILGVCHFLNRYPGNEEMINALNWLSSRLTGNYTMHADTAWQWFEPSLAYDNAVLPLALWCAYNNSRNQELLALAERTTEFLTAQTLHNGRFSPVGNQGWMQKGGTKAVFEQQPIEAAGMILLLEKAFDLTGEETFRKNMLVTLSWFHGNNNLHIPLYDEQTHGCCDGIGFTCINRNQGAESTICYWLARLTVMPYTTRPVFSQKQFPKRSVPARS
ncbi:MAG: glycosyltransferase family 4 protein [Chitinophagaceae bacterium]|nr:glycosyltransferase family 4 protein [Chitinophagaceae bacterium]